ncbi:DUF6443 domain-containing protein [Flavobacterium sp. RS13.1]|uniref:DUF6443 domain-containing protein n=1 Tax=Flavobacterium sp. RS13.1 TaxID=3400345 RepID=UPI003AAC7372
MKKHILLFIFLSLTAMGVDAQTLSNDNFIYTVAPKKAVKTNEMGTLTKDEVTQNVTYFDGLGRPIQTIAINKGVNGQDIITPIEYDPFGRQAKENLPYSVLRSNNDLTKIDPLTAVSSLQTFYNTPKYENTTNPYSEKEFEASPLNRVLKQAAPGNDWSLSGTHTIKMDYQSNTANEVKLFSVTTTLDTNLGLYDIVLLNNTGTVFYNANELYKTISYDENTAASPVESSGSTVEFKNKEGQVVLKRTYQAGVKHDTYYVYDIYGNLTYVLPPKADGAITTTVLNDLCYQYKYDQRNRLVEKKLPGKDWEYIIYDKLDRPVLTQDANLRAQNKWLFTKYDAFSRPVYTGVYSESRSRALVQQTVDTQTTLFETKQGVNTINNTTVYYSNVAFPQTGIDLFTINYYDNYSFDLNGGVSENSGSVTPSTATKSLATGSKIRVLGTSSWITNVIYYDDKGRPIYNYSKNDFLAVTQKVKNELDFVGKPVKTTTTHTKNGTTTTLVDTFTYDHADRLKKQTQSINGATPEVIAENTYDELGQLISKGVGNKEGNARLQTVDYSYNIRGWLKGINDSSTANNAITLAGGDLFGFKINYNNPSTGTALYNGNISQTYWKAQGQDTALKNYTYSYDALNRLSSAVSQDSGRYNESLTYDKNGNILSLLRNGYTNSGATNLGIMDNLSYTYDGGNKLFKVKDTSGSTEGFNDGADSSQEYGYDANGNMISDSNKAITAISYNHLNLPVDITIAGSTIHYDYDATGAKQRKTVSGITTDYAAGFQYANNVLQFFPQPEGYVNYTNGNFEYIYQYKDHLGNNRLSYKNIGTAGSPATQIVEENNYYPFGLQQKVSGGVVNNTNYKYKFNGMELQDELGLNMYDYSARNYDPALGRWMNIDPLSEKGRRWSPYNYAMDNPVYFIDPDGMWPWPTWNSVKNFAKGFGSTMSSMAQGAQLHNQILGQVKLAVDVTKSVAKGDFKGAGNQLLESTGLPAVVRTAKKVVKGDAEAIGSVTAVAVLTAVTHKAGGAKASATAEGTIMESLSNAVKTTASELKATGKAPSVVVGAELNGQTTIASSGAPPTNVAPQLVEATAEIGGVGTKTASGNTVGCCAEFQAANSLLLDNPTATPGQINFTEAVRPRTGQTVPMCENCKTTFGQ